jgi:transposase-like protein
VSELARRHDISPSLLFLWRRQIGLQGAIKLAELGPKNLIDEAPRRPDHDGVAPLPMKT